MTTVTTLMMTLNGEAGRENASLNECNELSRGGLDGLIKAMPGKAVGC